MRVASTISDSIVDGPGLLFTVFTQGCPHRCPGCHNPETHAPNGGTEMSILELTRAMEKNPLVGGLTLSGGDPFLQAWECSLLAREAKQRGLSVWVYTGYTWEQLLRADNRSWLALLDQTDVLVDGPFLPKKKSYAASFRGSSNQRLIDVPESCARGELVLWTRMNPLAHFVKPRS